MKYLIVIILGILLGIHWSSDLGWFIIFIVVSLAITFIHDREYDKILENHDKEQTDD